MEKDLTDELVNLIDSKSQIEKSSAAREKELLTQINDFED